MPYLVCRLLLEKNFFNDTATTEIYTLSLHDALPIWKNLNPDTVYYSSLTGMGELLKTGCTCCLDQIGRAHV